MRIVFSGGGTGGHIFPAIAVAQEIQKRFPNVEILFVGADGKMEMTKVPKAGYPIKGLWISGFQRKLSIRNLLFPIKLLSSSISSYFILRRFKPDVVAGFGGYASGATLYVASLMGIPILIQEQNSFPGITNKLLASRAEKIAVAYDKAKKYFPIDKVVVTGNPIRSSLLEIAGRNKGVKHFGLDPSKKTVLIIGGSLGARTLNIGMRNNLKAIESLSDIQFIWQCGSLYIDEYYRSETAQLEHVQIMAFIDDMNLAYATADIVVSRAGALSVSELCAQGKATILVPSPNVAEDHQTKNALALVEKNAALTIKDAEFSNEFISLVTQLVHDTGTMSRLENNISQLAMPRAVEHIADELLKLVKS